MKRTNITATFTHNGRITLRGRLEDDGEFLEKDGRWELDEYGVMGAAFEADDYDATNMFAAFSLNTIYWDKALACPAEWTYFTVNDRMLEVTISDYRTGTTAKVKQFDGELERVAWWKNLDDMQRNMEKADIAFAWMRDALEMAPPCETETEPKPECSSSTVWDTAQGLAEKMQAQATALIDAYDDYFATRQAALFLHAAVDQMHDIGMIEEEAHDDITFNLLPIPRYDLVLVAREDVKEGDFYPSTFADDLMTLRPWCLDEFMS